MLTGSEGLLAAGVFVIAALYSSVGHGGASGYLALLALLSYAPAQMATTALTLNILVASVAAYSYWRGGHFSWRLTWPFLLTSMPFAFLGGTLQVSQGAYSLLLAFALAVAALRLVFAKRFANHESRPVRISVAPAIAAGSGIGLISGIVGVGGGIFLSPLLILLGWAAVKPTAATAAVFVALNSAAALAARSMYGTINVDAIGWLPVAALARAILG